jgi:hypothetical protein
MKWMSRHYCNNIRHILPGKRIRFFHKGSTVGGYVIVIYVGDIKECRPSIIEPFL